jgi:hypothetical protein
MTAAFSHLDLLEAESIHIFREAAALLEAVGVAVELEDTIPGR